MTPRATFAPVARASETKARLTKAALAYIDAHGLDALTLRILGAETDLHHTALYRHFRGKDEVLNAVLAMLFEELLRDVGPLPADPQERLFALVLQVRRMFLEHPAVAPVLLIPSRDLADSDAARSYTAAVLDAITEIGHTGPARAQWYRVMESYALGTSAFDFAGAPHHLASRSERLSAVPDEVVAAAVRTEQAVQELNESSFELGLRSLVQACAAAAKG